jgi:fermentation-respiration switch protein FrsA (DUF1100 family)
MERELERKLFNTAKIDYTVLDQPEVLRFLFHPRPEPSGSEFQVSASDGSIPVWKDMLIPVEENVVIGARFHMAAKSGANIVFFHGNGEIVADYDQLGGVLNQMGINLLALDYRGYGRSTGNPTVSAMMRDCHIIFDFVQKWLPQNSFSGPVILMGRSLGSASVLELAAVNPNLVDGLIVESGFAFTAPLLKLLGIDLEMLGFEEALGFRNIDKIKKVHQPTLIIHAEFDHIIPFSDGQALYDACPNTGKMLLKIPGANHNDIFMRGLQDYLTAIKSFTDNVKKNASLNKSQPS